MPRRIGAQSFEGQYFIVTVPDGWTEGDPLPPPAQDDRWFDRLTDFKAALDCPWVRRPMRHAKWTAPAERVGATPKGAGPVAPSAPTNPAQRLSE